MEKGVPISLDKAVDIEASKTNKIKRKVRKVDLKFFGVNESTKCNQKVQQSRDELVLEQTSESSRVLHKGILVEKGILECLKPQMCETFGDSNYNTAHLTKDKLVEQIEAAGPKQAQVKGILMEKGILHSTDNVTCQFGKYVELHLDFPQKEGVKTNRKDSGNVLEEMKYVLQLSSDVNRAYLKELLVEKGLMESWVKESEIHSDRKSVGTVEKEAKNIMNAEEIAKCSDKRIMTDLIESPTEMTRMINDINQFTLSLEGKPDNIDWQQFHSNLLKIHKFYLQNVNKTPPKEEVNEADTKSLEKKVDHGDVNLFEALTQVEFDIEDMMEPLSKLKARSTTLNYNIKGIENIISSIDRKVEQFYTKYYNTLLQREQSYKDMIGLEAMRKTIGKRLSQVEFEIFESRTRLLKRGVQNK